MKNIIKYTALIGATLLLPVSVFAASLTLAPDTVTSKVGETFTLTITADPAGTKSYTTRANVTFDASSIEFMSFSFAPKWIALSQTGYDTEDNVKGIVVKTAGYPSGFTASTILGTATFRVKATGSSAITITSDSLALDANGKNLIIGTQGSTRITVSAPATTSVTPVSAPVITGTASTEEDGTTTEISSADQVAAVGATGFSFGSTSSILIEILLLVGIIGGIWYYRRKVN